MSRLTLYVLVLWFIALQSVAAPGTVDDATLSGSDASGWPAYGRTFDQQRFSPLSEINTTTVGTLGLSSGLELPAVLSPTAFESIVRGGALEARGMPRFAELSTGDLTDLRAFVRSRADASAPGRPASK